MASTVKIRYAARPVTAAGNCCGTFAERPMAAREVLPRAAMIQQMAADRKGPTKTTQRPPGRAGRGHCSPAGLGQSQNVFQLPVQGVL